MLSWLASRHQLNRSTFIIELFRCDTKYEESDGFSDIESGPELLQAIYSSKIKHLFLDSHEINASKINMILRLMQLFFFLFVTFFFLSNKAKQF